MKEFLDNSSSQENFDSNQNSLNSIHNTSGSGQENQEQRPELESDFSHSSDSQQKNQYSVVKVLLWSIGLATAGFLCLLFFRNAANSHLISRWSTLVNYALNGAPKISEQKPTIRPIKVLTTSAIPVEDYRTSRKYTGTIVAANSSNLGFERSGKLVTLPVGEGIKVKRDQPLAILSTQTLESERLELLAARAEAEALLEEMIRGPRKEEIASAQAVVKNAQARVDLAAQQLRRRQKLFKEGAISQEQLDIAASETDALDARVDEAQKRFELLKTGTREEQILAQKARIKQIQENILQTNINIAKSTLRAPFDGTVASHFLDQGTVANAGQPVIRLLEDSHLEVRIGIPTALTESLKLGHVYVLEIAEKLYQGKLITLLPELDESTNTVTAILTFNHDTKPPIFPGQLARLTLEETTSIQGYWLPLSALFRSSQGLWSCYVLKSVSPDRNEDNSYKVARQSVEILHIDDQNALVRGTLQSGEQVIADGVHRIIDGQWVRPSSEHKE